MLGMEELGKRAGSGKDWMEEKTPGANGNLAVGLGTGKE
jgi:hypothetical protein